MQMQKEATNSSTFLNPAWGIGPQLDFQGFQLTTNCQIPKGMLNLSLRNFTKSHSHYPQAVMSYESVLGHSSQEAEQGSLNSSKAG